MLITSTLLSAVVMESIIKIREVSLGAFFFLVPERTRDIAAIGVRALIAATLATLMTASVAGTFFNQSSILLGR